MLSLTQLLYEIKASTNHAIFLAGAAGSGKTYISKQLGIPNNYTSVNIDDTYELLLKKSGIGSDQKHFGPAELSKAAHLMQVAKKATTEKYQKLLSNNENIIVDGTGSSSKSLLKRKQELEDLGYKTFMIAIYVSPMVSLERNAKRERSLMPSIILRSWRDYTKNINIYRQSFGANFILVNNNPKDSILGQEYSPEEIKKLYFDTTTVHGKPKSKEEMDKASQSKEEINREVSDLVKIEQQFDDIETAKNKINSFIK